MNKLNYINYKKEIIMSSIILMALLVLFGVMLLIWVFRKRKRSPPKYDGYRF